MLISDPVFLALLTTEPGGAGTVVRYEAERHEGDAKTKPQFRRLARLARPNRRLTVAQARVTGLTNRELDSAPELDEVLEDLREFAAGAGALVVAEGEAARKVLSRAAAEVGLPRGLGAPILGVDELGAIVHPTLCRSGVVELLRHYGLGPFAKGPGDSVGTGPVAVPAPSATHATAALLREVWQRLEAELLRLPLPVIAEMNWLLAQTEHPLREVLKQSEKHAVETQFAATFTSGRLSIQSLFKDFSELIKKLGARGEMALEGAAAPPPTQPVTAQEVAELLGPSGPLAKALPGYEDRREQIELAGAVAEALTAGRHLLAEAGTGVGKSLAYLVPGVLFAQRAGRPVMVSTHTKNLQSQLYHKDLPLLRKAMRWDFRSALLKGRPNYLCLRKLMYTLQEASHELEDDERAALLPVVTWATQTATGDVAELVAFSPEVRRELWDRLHTIGEDCLSRQCPFFNRCFVYRARALAHSADVVVLNHALVFAELGLENGTLPPYHEIIFDEAHTLEDVATEHLACEVTPRRISRILHWLFRTSGGSAAGKGLLPSLLFQLEQAKSEFPEPLFQSLREHLLQAIQAVGPAETAQDVFFGAWRDWYERPAAGDDESPVPPFVSRRDRRERMAAPPFRQDAPPGRRRAAPRRSGGEARRFAAVSLRPDETELLRGGKETLVAALGRLRQALAGIEEDFAEIRKRDVPRARELQKELTAQALFLQELIGDLEFVVKGDEPNYVYWAEPWGPRALRVVAAPLDLSGLLHAQLYERKRAVVLTSATLSVRDAAAGAESGLAPWRPYRPPAAEDAPTDGDAEDLAPPAALDERPHPKSFEFLKQRLGLALCAPARLDERLEGSPFDYARQCRLYVPAFLPEPGARERDFNGSLSALLAPLAIASAGRALVLYTSYEALTSGATVLRKALAPEHIEVLAQGEDGSREALLDRLREGRRTVLLGTTSFWEGVDVPGQALSLLVIAKLPFAVFTDPLVEGRCELLEAQGKDPFLHFSVPNAILRLRQGFGRLIRTKTDRGVVVLCDKRVLTKRYGPAFLRALPVPARKAADPDRLALEVREFLREGQG